MYRFLFFYANMTVNKKNEVLNKVKLKLKGVEMKKPFCFLLGRSASKAFSSPEAALLLVSTKNITTSGLVQRSVQRHSIFERLCEHNRLKPEPIRFVRLDSEHAQSDGKSVNRGLPVLDLARGRDFSWCLPKGARPLGTRMPQKKVPSVRFRSTF